MQTVVIIMNMRDIYSCDPIETQWSLGYILVRKQSCVNLCEVCAIYSFTCCELLKKQKNKKQKTSKQQQQQQIMLLFISIDR